MSLIKLFRKYFISLNFNGKNNKIIAIKNNQEYPIRICKANLRIIGDNNIIKINCDKIKKPIITLTKGLSMKINGNNNQIVFDSNITYNNSIISMNGNNNQIVFDSNITYNNSIISMNGNNNSIIINGNSGLNSSNLEIEGENNTFEVDDAKFKSSKIYLTEDKNSFILKKPVKQIQNAIFYVEDGGIVKIDENCEIGNGDLYVVVNGDYKNRHGLYVHRGCRIARGAIIRTSDGECLLDPITRLPNSEPKDVIFEENCWITSRCTILKGTYLPTGTIVAAHSLVNKKFEAPNSLIGGVPAKIIKTNVFWATHSYGYNMKNLEKNYE